MDDVSPELNLSFHEFLLMPLVELTCSVKGLLVFISIMVTELLNA